jgi:SAM-dependent methyltransferase
MMNNLESISQNQLTKSIEENSILTQNKNINGVTEENLIISKNHDIDMKPKAQHFYDFPRYYDKAFTRDVISDIKFFQKSFQLYSDINVKCVLEPACGPGMFLEALPKFGYITIGYDLNPAMVEYSKERLRKCGISEMESDAVVGNMKDMKFEIKYDAAFVCINSLGYLRNDEDIISHFKATGESLKKGGIYIVEISCKCDDIKNEKKYDDTWYVKENGLEIELTWAINWYDTENRIRHVDFQMVVEENGQKLVVQEAHELRLWIYDEFKKLAQAGGFELMAVYNQSYDFIPPDTSITGELGALFFVLKNVKN